MYRIGLIIVSIVAVTFGLLVGILNHDLVRVDLLWVQLDWPLGLLLLLALATGMLVGVSIAWLFTVIPLQLQLRKARRVAPGGIASTGGIAVTDRTND